MINGDVVLVVLDKFFEIIEEICICCVDLKVFGRKEFKFFLKWCLKVWEIFGFFIKKLVKVSLVDEVVEVELMDEEMRI